MKNFGRKVLGTGLSAVMAAGLLAGCGSSTASTSASAASSAASKSTSAASTADAGSTSASTSAASTATETDNSKIKIGVSIWSSTDVLGSQCKLILDEAAKALGVEVQYVDQGHVSEKVTASVEQLCAAGCQGIIICKIGRAHV